MAQSKSSLKLAMISKYLWWQMVTKNLLDIKRNFDLVLHVHVDLKSISDKFQSQTHSKVLSVTVCGSSENIHRQSWKQKQKNNVWNEHCF